MRFVKIKSECGGEFAINIDAIVSITTVEPISRSDCGREYVELEKYDGAVISFGGGHRMKITAGQLAAIQKHMEIV